MTRSSDREQVRFIKALIGGSRTTTRSITIILQRCGTQRFDGANQFLDMLRQCFINRLQRSRCHVSKLQFSKANSACRRIPARVEKCNWSKPLMDVPRMLYWALLLL
jgi:hypothetical protein